MTEADNQGPDERVVEPDKHVPGTAIRRRDAVTVALEACVIIDGTGASSLPPKVIEIFEEAKGGTLGATPDQLTAVEQFEQSIEDQSKG